MSVVLDVVFCENPTKDGGACGKCRACRQKKSNEKMICSIFAAYEYRTKGQFLTLTYDDAHVPYGLKHEHFQSFMKKLRDLDGTPGVKYFMAGEYGGDENGTHREHFHVLFYNHRYDIDLVQKAWSEPRKRGRKRKGEVDPFIPFGFVYDGTLTPASMKYVSGYIDKKGYDPESGKRPPYGRSSVNIPDSLTDREIERACKSGRIMYNGRSFSFPHKWRRRYSDIWNKYRSEREQKRYSAFQERVDKAGGIDSYIEHMKAFNFSNAERCRRIMDDKESKYLQKKAERKQKKLLQKLNNKRIM